MRAARRLRGEPVRVGPEHRVPLPVERALGGGGVGLAVGRQEDEWRGGVGGLGGGTGLTKLGGRGGGGAPPRVEKDTWRASGGGKARGTPRQRPRGSGGAALIY